MRNIFIYYDEGSSESSRGMLIAFLRRRFKESKRIRRIYADDICRSDDWHHNTDLMLTIA